MRKHAKTCESMKNHVNASENILKHVKIYEIMCIRKLANFCMF